MGGNAPAQRQGVASFADATSFIEFSRSVRQATTSNGWVRYNPDGVGGYTFQTATALDTGRYQIQLSCDLEQSDKEKRVAVRIQTREGTSGGWTTRRQATVSVGFDGTSFPIALQKTFDVNTVNILQIRIQFGQTDDGGTGAIDEVDVILFRVGDL